MIMVEMNCFMFILFYLLSTGEALRWSRSDVKNDDDTYISLIRATKSYNFDMSFGKQITIIKDSAKFDYDINIYCFIAGYDEKDPMELSFCKDSEFYNLADNTNETTILMYKIKSTYKTSHIGKKGLKVSLRIEATDNDLSGNYYCRAKNNNFAIRSNNIEIRDVFFWSTHWYKSVNFLTKNEIKTVKQDTLPQVIKCSGGSSVLDPSAPKWTKIEFVSAAMWTVCPVINVPAGKSGVQITSKARCAKFTKDNQDEEQILSTIYPRKLKKMPDWTTFVNQDGDLLFTELKPSVDTAIDSYSLMCYTFHLSDTVSPMYYYYSEGDDKDVTKGIVVDGTPMNFDRPLDAISPVQQDFTLYAREDLVIGGLTALKPVFIYALYKSSSRSTSSWKKNDNILAGSNLLTVGKYTLAFIREVTYKDAGNYSLEVVDGSSKLIMNITLHVLGPPIILMDACMVPVNYVWEGESRAISCEYVQRPTEVKIQINSQDIDLNLKHADNVVNLKKSHPYLEMLSFTTSPHPYVMMDTVTISYSVNNLTKSIGQTQYQDHTVTFLATNDYGISVKTSSIYVVPRLKTAITYAPDRDNCTVSCSSADTHIFQCGVKTELYEKKEIRVAHYWTINSHRLDDLDNNKNMYTRYFLVDPLTKKLTMMPIKSNDTNNDDEVKKVLRDNFIECHFDIYTTAGEDGKLEYLSTSDKSLGNSMKIRITLDNNMMNTASLYWIIAVILGLIVLIIVIVLLTRYCMKNKGETYPLDKLEREHGYDPDKEVQDEMFKPYERQEHDPEIGPGSGDERRLSITGHSVGSNDDGELDNYELDPSNFNEDGSIIGKYGANPRSRAAMA